MTELGHICWKTVNVEVLVEALRRNEIMDLSSKTTLLLMGTTNSGKTTTLCYLANKQLRLESEPVHGLDGWSILPGPQVLDTVESIEDFRIGHTNESTTKCIKVYEEIPEAEFVIADTCGFGDSEGIYVDIINAISLRNGMMSCESVRPVFIIDVRNLITDKGASFSKLLGLIQRFFDPIHQYLGGMSFLFSHCEQQDSASKIMAYLSNICRAAQIRESPHLQQIVERIFEYVKKYGSRSILCPSEMAGKACQIRSQSVLSMILEAPAITDLTGLGNPLSTEAVTAIRDKCIECRVSIMESVRRHFYVDAEEKMSALKSLDEYMRVDEVREQFSLALESIEEGLDTLIHSTRADLIDCKYDKLAPLLKQLSEARNLHVYKDVREEYYSMLAELDGLVNQLAHEVLARSPADDDVVSFMDKLHEIHSTLSEFLNASTKQLYDRVRTKLKDHCESVQSECCGFLQSLHGVLQKDVLPDVWCGANAFSGVTEMGWVPLLKTLTVFLASLATLSTMKKMRIFSETSTASDRYNALVQDFCTHLSYLKSVLLHNGGLLCHLESGKLSEIQCIRLCFLHDIAQTSVLCGLANHTLDTSLVSLPADVTAAVRSALLAHYQTVQDRLNCNQFVGIREPLQQLGRVHLNDAEFLEFRGRLVEHAAQLVSSRLTELYEGTMKTSMHLAGRETADFSDYERLVHDLFLLRSGTCLDALLASALTFKSVSVMCSEVLSAFGSDWSRRCNELSSSVLQGDMRGKLVKRFVRLDCMLPLEQIVHAVAEDVPQVAKCLENEMQNTLSSELEAENDISMVLVVLKSLDVWEDLYCHLDASHLVKLSCIESLRQYKPFLQRKRNDIVSLICKRLAVAKDSVHVGFSQRDAGQLNDSLNVLRDCCLLDDYLDPKASAMYMQLKINVLESMKRSAEVAVSYGEVEETKKLRALFEKSDLFAHHFEGLADLNFHSMAKELMNRHRSSAEKVTEEVASLLSRDSIPFDIIREKLLSVMQLKEDSEWDPKDKSIFFKCEREVSKYLCQLELSCCDCDSMAEEDAVRLLTRFMRIAGEAMVLKELLVSYDPAQLLKLVVDASLSLYSKIEGKARRHLSQWRFEAASERFEKMLRFNKMSISQTHAHMLEFNEHESNFRQRNKDFLNQNIKPLKDDIMHMCGESLGEVITDRQDFDRLNTIISSVDSAVRYERGLFSEEVDFFDIRSALIDMVYGHGVLLHTQFKEAVDKGDVDGARACNRNMYIIKHISDEFMEPTKSSRIAEQYQSQSEDLRSMQDIDPIRTFEMTTSSVRTISNSMKQLRLDSYSKHCELSRKITDCLRQRMNDFNPIESDSRPDDVFEFMRTLWLYEASVGFQNDVTCLRLMKQCEDRFKTFVGAVLKVYDDRLKACQDIELLVMEVSNLRDCAVSTVTFINETELATSWLNSLGSLQQKCSALLSRAELILEDISSSDAVFSSFEIFSLQNIEKIVKTLELLEKQGRGKTSVLGDEPNKTSSVETSVDSIFRDVESRIDNAFVQVAELLSRSDYEKLAIGLFNLEMLGKGNRLHTKCRSTADEVGRAVENCCRRILEEFRRAFLTDSGSIVDLLIGEAESMDRAFRDNCPGRFELLMTKITAEFALAIDSLLASQDAGSSHVESHASVIFRVKSFVDQISSTAIQQLAFRRIEDYLGALSSSKTVDLFALGMALYDLGPLGREITESHPQFKATVTKRFNKATAHITLDHALNDLVIRNPTMTATQRGDLKWVCGKYDNFFEHNLRLYLAGYSGSFSAMPLDKLINSVVGIASSTNPSKVQIAEALAGIFAVFTITNSQDIFRDSRGDRECLMKPHAVQLLAIFRLLGLDRSKGLWNMIAYYLRRSSSRLFDGHLAQVGTGEGKSILLGGLSCLLALMGYEVYCASYSEYLSRRDYIAFEELFKAFGVEDRVHYSTLSDLMETVINRRGDIRSKTDSFIFNDEGAEHESGQHQVLSCNDVAVQTAKKRRGNEDHEKLATKRILLFDEVDVFFNDTFFGATYEPVSLFSSPETVGLLTYVWRNNNARLSLQHMQQLPEYTALIAKCHTAFKPVVDKAISFMIEDVKDFAKPQYVVVDSPEGKLIGYKQNDSVSTSIRHRYKTAFAYLYESTVHADMRLKTNKMLSLLIPCGLFSYAEVPKMKFDCIMGVTGTLDCVSVVQKGIMVDDYLIQDMTFAPSMYGDSKLAHKKDTGVVMEDDEARYHQTIAKDIADERDKGREYGARLTDVNIVTEKTNNVDFFVNKATVSGAVTLFPRVFGRGLDFRVRDAAVDDAGGVHVIQTFFSECTSEEIQIKGRTARQAKKGSYKLILLLASLEKFGFTSQALSNMYQTSSFYDGLHQSREKMMSEHIETLKKRVHAAQSMHKKSMEFLSQLNTVQCTPDLVAKFVASFQVMGGSGLCPTHVVFCLDESGSMSNYWAALLQAVLEFLRIRNDGGAVADIISVIQFGSGARLTMNALPLIDAMIACSQLNFGGGGTVFVPALNMAESIITGDTSTSDVIVVFMTDGECGDAAASIPATKRVAQACRDRKAQFFGVSFRSAAQALQDMMKAVNGTMVAATNVQDLTSQFQFVAKQCTAQQCKR